MGGAPSKTRDRGGQSASGPDEGVFRLLDRAPSPEDFTARPPRLHSSCIERIDRIFTAVRHDGLPRNRITPQLQRDKDGHAWIRVGPHLARWSGSLDHPTPGIEQILDWIEQLGTELSRDSGWSALLRTLQQYSNQQIYLILEAARSDAQHGAIDAARYRLNVCRRWALSNEVSTTLAHEVEALDREVGDA